MDYWCYLQEIRLIFDPPVIFSIQLSSIFTLKSSKSPNKSDSCAYLKFWFVLRFVVAFRCKFSDLFRHFSGKFLYICVWQLRATRYFITIKDKSVYFM